jgi:hypothetical protein
MNFDELFKYCQELNKSNSEKCLVCHIPVENKDKHVKLNCNHIFHPDCINYLGGSIKCLYCEKKSLPEKINWNQTQNQICKIVLKTGPKKGQFCNRTNCLYHKVKTSTIEIIEIKCDHVIKSGVNAGKQCDRKSPCKYHNKNLNEIIV